MVISFRTAMQMTLTLTQLETLTKLRANEGYQVMTKCLVPRLAVIRRATGTNGFTGFVVSKHTTTNFQCFSSLNDAVSESPRQGIRCNLKASGFILGMPLRSAEERLRHLRPLKVQAKLVVSMVISPHV